MILESKDQHVYFGASGGEEFLRNELGHRGGQRILVVRGGASFSRSGSAYFLEQVIGNLESEYVAVDGIKSTLENIREGVVLMKRFLPDCILGIGGGAVLDMAKLIGYFSASDQRPEEWIRGERSPLKAQPIPKILIPTTAGSGSEATSFAVLYDGNDKYSVADPSMLAEVVMLNPGLVETMNGYLAACSGFDALAQGMESYLAIGATRQSREYSIRAVELCIKHLESGVAGEEQSRAKMLEAAHWAGKAINIAKTTGAHALSYILTSKYGVPHGHAVSVFLPGVLIHNAGLTAADCNHPEGIQYVKQSMKDMCCLFDCEKVEELADSLEVLKIRLGLGMEWILQRGLAWRDIKDSVIHHYNAERLLNNPRCLTEASISRLLDRVNLEI